MSKQDNSEKWVSGEVYEEKYDQDKEEQFNISESDDNLTEDGSSDGEGDLMNPRGYKDIITSAQGGDTILILFVGEKIKDVELNIKLYMRLTDDHLWFVF